jgi:hypothetical protein
MCRVKRLLKTEKRPSRLGEEAMMNLEYLTALLIYITGVSAITILAVLRKRGIRIVLPLRTLKRCFICMAAWLSDYFG